VEPLDFYILNRVSQWPTDAAKKSVQKTNQRFVVAKINIAFSCKQRKNAGKAD